jgi:exopolysaccharide biosynthesis polyprenyl glycosylphosphotransferase
MVDVERSLTSWTPSEPADEATGQHGLPRAVAPVARIPPVGRNRHLRPVLVALDAVAAAFGWSSALLLIRPGTTAKTLLAVVPVLSLLTIGSFMAQHLYRSRVCALRAQELTRLAHGAAIAALAAVAVGPKFGDQIPLRSAAAAVVVVVLATATVRSIYLSWLRLRRASGRYTRPIIVVGTNDDAARLVELIADHPEQGFRVAGVVGDAAEWARPESVLGTTEDLIAIVRRTGVTGALIATTSLSAAELNGMVRALHREGIHVQVSSPVVNLGHRRVRSAPIAHEPLIYLEPPHEARWQPVVKRVIDITVSVTTLIVSAPILGIAAVAIKLDDRGPIFYRQQRVGLAGHPFEVLKLRTMVNDAGAQLPMVLDLNERRGPLFKIERDPRVTRVGRLLRAFSIDEIPQLVNVLSGNMSLVGPRPALPEEVVQFDEELLARFDVLPGLTGLWQVEGRDNPSFAVYRRLDLFYVENRSLGLDLSILLATVRVVLGRGIRVLWPRTQTIDLTQPSTAGSPVVLPAADRAS